MKPILNEFVPDLINYPELQAFWLDFGMNKLTLLILKLNIMNITQLFEVLPPFLSGILVLYMVLGFFRLKRMLRLPLLVMAIGLLFVPVLLYVIPFFALFELIFQLIIINRKLKIV